MLTQITCETCNEPVTKIQRIDTCDQYANMEWNKKTNSYTITSSGSTDNGEITVLCDKGHELDVAYDDERLEY